MPERGLEPPSLARRDFESRVYQFRHSGNVCILTEKLEKSILKIFPIWRIVVDMDKIKGGLLSYIEISKENLIHNINQFKSILKKDAKVAAVIKANAYGHGDREIAKIASPYVDYFQVDGIEEAERVRSVTKPILILGYLNDDGIREPSK